MTHSGPKRGQEASPEGLQLDRHLLLPQDLLPHRRGQKGVEGERVPLALAFSDSWGISPAFQV